MKKIRSIVVKKMHLYGVWKIICMFFINHMFAGMGTTSRKIKRVLLNSCGNSIGKDTMIVSPIIIKGKLITGNNCWINCGFTVHGNGTVTLGNDCDIAPDVTFLTGGHQIGASCRRAGKGETYNIRVGNGVWIGSRATILGSTFLNDGCVVAACACVIKDVPPDVLVGGVPAKIIRSLDHEHTGPDSENPKEKSC